MKIDINSLRDLSVSRQINVSLLPADYTVPHSRVGGWLLILFALVWGGVPTLMFLNHFSGEVMGSEAYFVLIFPVIGLMIIINGIYMVSMKERIIIDQNTVTLDKKSILGHTLWTESLNKFAGVRAATEYHSGGKNRSSYTLYFIELYHEEKKKRIRLYEAKHSTNFRQLFEEYSRQLKLPALEGEEGQFVKRDASDLDKSVRELVAEGKLKVDFDPSRRPPKGITAEMKDQRLCINLPAAPLHLGGMFGAFLFIGVFGFIGFFADDASVTFGIIAIILLLIFIGAISLDRYAPPVLEVGRDKIKYYRIAPWGDTMEQSISTEEIESVYVGQKHANQGKKGVMVVSDTKSIKIAEGQPEETLEWIKNCILGIVAR